jgi:hypothetical protein
VSSTRSPGKVSKLLEDIINDVKETREQSRSPQQRSLLSDRSNKKHSSN